MIAFQFYYKITANSKTQYIYIIATTLKQAWWYLYNQYGHIKKYYSMGRGNYDLPQTKWYNKHKVGEIYGGDAII